MIHRRIPASSNGIQRQVILVLILLIHSHLETLAPTNPFNVYNIHRMWPYGCNDEYGRILNLLVTRLHCNFGCNGLNLMFWASN